MSAGQAARQAGVSSLDRCDSRDALASVALVYACIQACAACALSRLPYVVILSLPFHLPLSHAVEERQRELLFPLPRSGGGVRGGGYKIYPLASNNTLVCAPLAISTLKLSFPLLLRPIVTPLAIVWPVRKLIVLVAGGVEPG